MNWTASLLRNQLKKEREASQAKLNLLASTSEAAQQCLLLEAKLQEKESFLLASEEKLTELKSAAENRQKEKESELINYNQALFFAKNEELAEQLKEKEEEIRKLNLYHQRNLRNNSKEVKEQLKDQEEAIASQQRELNARAKLITQLEEQSEELKKQLDFASSKIKQLNPLFSQVLAVIKKNVILWDKSVLKEAVRQIQELMNWEKSPLVTETNTPTGEETKSPKITEPIKKEEQLASEEIKGTDKKKLKKWKNISLNFTEELINQWESKGFSYEKTADWINIGFTVKDAEYAFWLEKGVGLEPLKYLNEISLEEQQDLKKQFEEYKKSNEILK